MALRVGMKRSLSALLARTRPGVDEAVSCDLWEGSEAKARAEEESMLVGESKGECKACSSKQVNLSDSAEKL